MYTHTQTRECVPAVSLILPRHGVIRIRLINSGIIVVGIVPSRVHVVRKVALQDLVGASAAGFALGRRRRGGLAGIRAHTVHFPLHDVPHVHVAGGEKFEHAHSRGLQNARPVVGLEGARVDGLPGAAVGGAQRESVVLDAAGRVHGGFRNGFGIRATGRDGGQGMVVGGECTMIGFGHPIANGFVCLEATHVHGGMCGREATGAAPVIGIVATVAHAATAATTARGRMHDNVFHGNVTNVFGKELMVIVIVIVAVVIVIVMMLVEVIVVVIIIVVVWHVL